MRKMLASHPDFPEINRAQESLAALTNPACHFNLNGMVESDELPTLDRNCAISSVTTTLESLLDGGLFRDFITTALILH